MVLAILKWLVHVIKTKPQEHVIEICPYILQPMCSLSMHPEIRQYCANEVHLVLFQFEKWMKSQGAQSEWWEYYCPSIFSAPDSTKDAR